jgi:hypothetical protein
VGPIYWLVFTLDGQRRTDLVVLQLLGQDELDLAIERLHSGLTESGFRKLFPGLDLACNDGASPFGDRLCVAEVGAFNAVPARAFTLFLRGDQLRAAKLDYRHSYHETLKQQLTRRLGSPASRAPAGQVPVAAPIAWKLDDGLLLLPPRGPESDQDAALIWLSQEALQQ